MFFWVFTACNSAEELEEKTTTEDSAALVDFDGDGFYEDEDCDDTSQNTHPGAVEICDGADNNCDGTIDEGVLTTYFKDSDEDGFGSEQETIEACSPETGYVSIGSDFIF